MRALACIPLLLLAMPAHADTWACSMLNVREYRARILTAPIYGVRDKTILQNMVKSEHRDLSDNFSPSCTNWSDGGHGRVGFDAWLSHWSTMANFGWRVEFR